MSTITCPRCRATSPARATQCPSCGASFAPAEATRPKIGFRVVRADGGPEVSVPMRGELFTCGKKADLSLGDDPFVTDLQARFYFHGPRLAVEDVGGTNGVFLRLKQERELGKDGELRVGRQRLVLEAVPPAAPAPDAAMAWGSPDNGCPFRLVQLIEGGLRGAAYPLKAGETSIGREVGDITFPQDGFVSGRHATLSVQANRVVVRDLGSSNGTFVRLQAPSYVELGDQLLIGRHLVRVDTQ